MRIDGGFWLRLVLWWRGSVGGFLRDGIVPQSMISSVFLDRMPDSNICACSSKNGERVSAFFAPLHD